MSSGLNRLIALLLALASMGPACVAHEAMGRPPSQAEVERIRSFSAWNGRPRIEYGVEPIPPIPASGYTGREPTGAAEPLDLDYHYAPPPPIPGDASRIFVKSVRVRDRGRGALIGGLTGAVALPVLTYTILALMPMAFGAGSPVFTCDDYCSVTAVLGHLVLPGAVIGALPGFLIGGARILTSSARRNVLTTQGSEVQAA